MYFIYIRVVAMGRFRVTHLFIAVLQTALKRVLCENLLFQLPPSSRVSPTGIPPCDKRREPTPSAPRGDTLGTRIDSDISLVMPLVRRRKEQHSSAHLYTPSSSALPAVVALRLQFRLRLSYGLNHFQKNERSEPPSR